MLQNNFSELPEKPIIKIMFSEITDEENPVDEFRCNFYIGMIDTIIVD